MYKKEISIVLAVTSLLLGALGAVSLSLADTAKGASTLGFFLIVIASLVLIASLALYSDVYMAKKNIQKFRYHV